MLVWFQAHVLEDITGPLVHCSCSWAGHLSTCKEKPGPRFYKKALQCIQSIWLLKPHKSY